MPKIEIEFDMEAIPEKELKQFVWLNYSPDEIFSKDELEQWAMDNGFTREED